MTEFSEYDPERAPTPQLRELAARAYGNHGAALRQVLAEDVATPEQVAKMKSNQEAVRLLIFGGRG